MTGREARAPGDRRWPAAVAALFVASAAVAVSRIPVSELPRMNREEATLLGLLDRQRGAEAVARARSLVAQSRLSHGSGSMETADAMDTFVRMVIRTGMPADRQEALDLARESIGIREKRCGSDCPELAVSLETYENLLWSAGRFLEGLSVAERDVGIRDKISGPASPETAISLYLLANFHRALGDYALAEKLLRQCLSIWRAAPGDQTMHVANTLHYLGFLRWTLGDLAGARELLEQALALRERATGLEREKVASETNSLGNLAWAMGEPSKAMALFDRAQLLWERTLGKSHPQVAQSLISKGRLLSASGDYAAATEVLRRALEIHREALGPDDWLVGRSLAELGRVAFLSGDMSEAERCFTRALEIQGSRQEWGGTEFASTLVDDARLALARGEAARAVNLALKGEDVARETFLRTVRGLGEEDALRYETVRRSGLDVALGALAAGPSGEIPDLPGAVSRIWDDVIRSRAMVLDGLAARERTEAPASGERPGLAEVQRTLPPGTALVAYVKYWDPLQSPHSPAAFYLAFLLPAGNRSPAVVLLGGAESIEAAIRGWQKEVAADPRLAPGREGDRRYLEAGARLRRAIWDPVAAALGNPRLVFIVPDDAVNLVSFASLPRDDGRYLIENGPRIHYLSAERGLAASPVLAPRGGVLALGDVSFDAAPPPIVTGEGEIRSSIPSCLPFETLRFDPLPGSRAEVDDVESLWKGTVPVLTLTGRGASEGAFKQSAPGRRILHLATHGYFLQDRCPSSMGKGPFPEQGVVVGENPLRLSGLAFAGANRRSEASGTDEDGILTAEEIASLDLRGTEWAVLSGCDTGLGQLVKGEGVVGLRTAFQVAGVGTVVMALWPVDDGAARIWMRRLYEGRLAGLGTAEAVRQAGLGMIESQRNSGGTTHPYFWGAFVASGDWR